MALELLLPCFASIGLLGCWCALRPAQRIAADTTLVAPWTWLAGGLGIWSATWLVTLLPGVSAGLGDRLGYLAAVALLAPPIAVLGARRPGAGVWGWFVVLPMLCVLGLPAIGGGWRAAGDIARLRVDLPPLLGFGLVLVMAVGNYVGTRFTPAALVFGLGLLLQVASASEFAGPGWPAPSVFRSAATLCLALSAGLAVRAARSRPVGRQPLDALWIEFRDLFGIVWAKRALERVNHSARAQQWPVRLHMHGFAPLEGRAARDGIDPETARRIEALLRWLLKRFVVEAWIDRRLGCPVEPTRPD